MARYRTQHVAAAPEGWRVRSKRAAGHVLRIAFPPGRRTKGSGRVVEVLHPKRENPGCDVERKNPEQLLIFGLGNPSTAYRGYLITRSLTGDVYYISKGGAHIASAKSEAAAKKEIDGLTANPGRGRYEYEAHTDTGEVSRSFKEKAQAEAWLKSKGGKGRIVKTVRVDAPYLGHGPRYSYRREANAGGFGNHKPGCGCAFCERAAKLQSGELQPPALPNQSAHSIARKHQKRVRRMLAKMPKPIRGVFQNPSAEYERALAKHEEARKKFAAVRAQYRGRQVGDDAYLAAKRVYDAATREFDAAYKRESKRNPGWYTVEWRTSKTPWKSDGHFTTDRASLQRRIADKGKGTHAGLRIRYRIAKRKGPRENPGACGERWRKPAGSITDRGLRYRANSPECRPQGPRVCAFCGSRRNVEVHHLDGHEETTAPENLAWACRACNTAIGRQMQGAGIGRLTAQYNPSDGAQTLSQWVTAVLAMKGQNDAMTVPAAVKMIRATPASRRTSFANQIWKRRRRPARRNPDETQQAVQLYQTFHGKDPRGVVEKQEPALMREDYTAIGPLEHLVIKSPLGQSYKVEFEGDGVILASSPDGRQLYCIGGNQNLAGVLDAASLQKDLIDLGECIEVQYLARKVHTNFEPVSWHHSFGENSGERPELIYDKLKKRIFFAGGAYYIDTSAEISPGIEN